MKNIITFFTILFLSTFIVEQSLTQEQIEEMDWRMGPERIEKYKKMRLIEDLELQEDIAIRFNIKSNKHEERLQDLMKSRIDMEEQITKLLGPKKDIELDLKELQKLLKELEENRNKVYEEEKRYLKELKDIFTAEQLGKYYIFQRKFQKELREAIKQLRKDMPRRKMREGLQ